MTKAQDVYERVEALVASGVRKADAFRQIAEEFGQPFNSIRGAYYAHTRTLGPKPPRPRKRETTMQDAIGKIVWHGVEYEGAHEPLVSRQLFDRVQEVFRLHDRAGVRQRRHNHYLRGTVFCGTCGSRMSSLTAKGRFTYFYCLGGHGVRRTGCAERYVPASELEAQIETLYEEIRLDEEHEREVLERLDHELQAVAKTYEHALQAAQSRLAQLESEREKLLRAYYEDAIPLALLKKEQARIDVEVASARAPLDRGPGELETARELFEVAVKLAARCAWTYRRAKPHTRRRHNQAFFEAVYVQNRRIVQTAYREPFDAILGGSSKTPLVDYS